MNEKYSDDDLNCLIEKSKKDDIESLYLLGGHYLDEGDVAKSKKYFKKLHDVEETSADNCRFRGSYGMVCCYHQQNNIERQFFWYTKAAERGYVGGYYRASLLTNDEGVKLDCLKKGAGKGHLPSKMVLYKELRDKERNLFRRLKWSFLVRFYMVKFLIARKKDKNSELVKC